MPDRITRDENGHVDEIFVTGCAHLEAMDVDHKGGKRWFLALTKPDGTEVCLWLKGRITYFEERAKE